MKKLLLVLGIVFGLPACGLLGGECGDLPAPTYYDVQGLDVGLLRRLTDGQSANVENATVASRELRLRLHLRERHYSAVRGRGLGAAAYACDPVPAGSLGSQERMDSLSITSAYPYDAAHPAGARLNDLLDRGQPALQPSRQNPKEPFRFVELSLRSPPAVAGPQRFRVYYRQTNGEVYTAQTAIITVLP